MLQVLPIFSQIVNCLNGWYNSKDPRDYGWKEHEGKYIPLKKLKLWRKQVHAMPS